MHGRSIDAAGSADRLQAESRALNRAFAIAVFDVGGRLVRANTRFLRLFGYDLEEVLHRPLSNFLPAGEGEGNAAAALWAALERNEERTVDGRHLRKDGEQIWVRSTFIPLPATEDDPFEVTLTAADLTQQQRKISDERGQIDAINRSLAVAHFALDGTLTDANPVFCAVLGFERDELIGGSHDLFVPAEELASEGHDLFWSGLATGAYRNGEFRRVGKGGREVWLQASYNPIAGIDGRVFKVVQYAADITEQRLRQSDYEWQVAAIARSSCVITFDMDGTILGANDHFLEATGYRLEEIQGRHHRLFVEPSYAHGPEYASFWRDLSEGRYQSGQYRRFGKNGAEIWLQATYNPVFDPNGRPIRIVKYATVVTREKLRQAEIQGQIAAIHKAQCVASFSLDGRIIDANDNFLDTFGYRFADVRGRHHSMFVEPHMAETAAYAEFWRALKKGEYRAGEFKRVGRNGREVWLQATYNPIFDMAGRPFRVVKYATDITAEKLRQADADGQIAAIDRSQGVVELDMDGTILRANENFLRILGHGPADVVGRHHGLLLEQDQAESAEYAEFWSLLRSGTHLSGMYKLVGQGGREVWIRATYAPILDLNGVPYKVVTFATDVTSDVAMAAAFEDARRQAQHDSATSLPNRVRLAAFMESALAQPGARLVTLYADLDRFKPVNDTFGHHVGDRVLGEVADRLRRTLAPDQMVARVGGDEFVIAIPDLPDEDIEAVCQRLQALVSEPIWHDTGEVRIGMSVGIAVSPGDGTTPDELLRAADVALYRSKQNGRGSLSFFSSEMNDRIVATRLLVDDMRRGLTTGDFFLEYQPRFDVASRTVRSVEALVRWSHPERGRISPADFIPLAEKCGLIVPLGAWVLRTACRAALGWPGIGVSVNVSPVQFRDGTLVRLVSDILAETGLEPGRLEIEITEGLLLENAELARTALDNLKDLGVKLAIDDFGTGYASLSYLRNYPFDVIKIDRQFISDLDKRDSGRAIVQAILALGQSLGLSVTAEGVETEDQLALLSQDACQEAQGFLLARPLVAPAIDQIVENARSARLQAEPQAFGNNPARPLGQELEDLRRRLDMLRGSAA